MSKLIRIEGLPAGIVGCVKITRTPWWKFWRWLWRRKPRHRVRTGRQIVETTNRYVADSAAQTRECRHD